MRDRKHKLTVLIVDDEHADELAGAFQPCDSVEKAGCLSEAIKALHKIPDVIILDVMFPENPKSSEHRFMAGRFLDELQKRCSDDGVSRPPIFLVSGQSEPAQRFALVEKWLAEGRIRDVLPKSMGDIGWEFFRAVLRHKVVDCFTRMEIEARNRALVKQNQELSSQLRIESELIGESSALRNIEQQIARVAPTNATVLIRGESGVGKELVARAIHYSSPRKEEPFVCLNCAALTETLLESELFGHEKGAFTGATEKKVGKFEAADHGTIFLDEIGEMSIGTQAKLLRILEGHLFERVGGNTPIRVDVRVVAATNQPLEQALEEGRFRRDLFYRLQVVEIRVPLLCDRKSDVPLLAEHFLRRFVRETGRKIRGFTAAAHKKMQEYHWPGNVRELRNVVERAVALSINEMLDVKDIMLSALDAGSSSSLPADLENASELPDELLTDLRMGDVALWVSLTADYREQVLGAVRRMLNAKGGKQLEAMQDALSHQTNPDPFYYYKALLYLCVVTPQLQLEQLEFHWLKLDAFAHILPLGKTQATKVLKGLAGVGDSHTDDCYVMDNPFLDSGRIGSALAFRLRPGLMAATAVLLLLQQSGYPNATEICAE